MENEFHELIREAQSYADILRRISDHSGGRAEDDSAPHTEQIDFDRLCELLDRIGDQLKAARQLDRDAAAVRQWLIGRIDSLRRGRQAFLDERRIGDNSSSLQTAPLSELIHRFEEVSASFRNTAPTGAKNMRRSRREFREFRS